MSCWRASDEGLLESTEMAAAIELAHEAVGGRAMKAAPVPAPGPFFYHKRGSIKTAT